MLTLITVYLYLCSLCLQLMKTHFSLELGSAGQYNYDFWKKRYEDTLAGWLLKPIIETDQRTDMVLL